MTEPTRSEPRTLSVHEAREHLLKFLPESWNTDVIGNFKWRLDQYANAIEVEATAPDAGLRAALERLVNQVEDNHACPICMESMNDPLPPNAHHAPECAVIEARAALAHPTPAGPAVDVTEDER